MDFRSFITITALSIFPLGLLPSGGTIAAENGNGKTRAALFSDNASKKIFDTKVSDSDQYDIIFVKPWEQRAKLVQKEDPQTDKNTPPKNPDIPETKEQIIEKFGAPQEAEPLKANKDAPRPFRAMMAALNIGDEQLAYEYSKKWVAYLDRLDKATTTVTGMSGKVLKKNSPEDGHEWTDDEKYKKYDKHLDSDIREELTEGRSRVVNLTRFLPERTRKLVVSKKSLESEGADLFFNETKVRANIRRELGPKIPISNQGRLDLYFFFDPRRSSSMMMAREIEQLHRKNKAENAYNLIGVALGDADPDTIQAFKEESGATFAVIAGNSSLPKIFGIKKNPTVLFHLPDSELSYYEEGLRKGYYLDEVRKLIQRSTLL